MLRLKISLVFILFSGLLIAQNYHAQRIMIKLKNTEAIVKVDGQLQVLNKDWQALNRKWNLSKIESIVQSKNRNQEVSKSNAQLLRLTFENELTIADLIHQYKALDLFHYVEPDYVGNGGGIMGITPNDAFYYNRQWGLFNDGTFNELSIDDADVDMEMAWEYTTGEESTVIAILDSGCRLGHPEFAGRFWNSGDQAGNNLDDDDNGYIDDTLGWDFVNNDNDPTDDHGHGTNVAGIMAATGNNEIGFAGINWKAKVMIGKILNSSNSGFYSDWTSAIYYAVDNGAEVINMSVGGSGFSAIMQEACDYAHANDVVIVVSMMNTNAGTSFYPAAYASTIAVGATDTNDERANPFFWNASSGSNFGEHHDLCAPGNFMYGLAYNSNTNYESYWGGTSQAAPIVAGVASLIKGIQPTYGVEIIRDILRSSAEDQVGAAAEDIAGWDQYHGSGRLNAAEALAMSSVFPSAQEQAANADFFRLMPNPLRTNGTVEISWNRALTSKSELTIYSNQGQLLQEQSVPILTKKLSIKAPQAAGVYIIQLANKAGHIFTQKFVVAE